MITKTFCSLFSIIFFYNIVIAQTNFSSRFNTIGIINRNGGAVPHLSLEYSINKNDTVKMIDTLFAIRFIDMTPNSPIFNATDLKVYNIYFNSKNYSLSNLYNTFLNVFSDNKYKEEKYETVIMLGDKSIIVKRDFYSSKPKLHCLVDDVMFIIKNTKELNKLFGR